MPTEWAYVSTEVADDDVASSIEEARLAAARKLGSRNIELYEKSWGPGWLCTTWRLVTPDPPPNP